MTTALARWWLLLVAAGACAGCGATVRPPIAVDRPTTIYLVAEGRHSSILLPLRSPARSPFAGGEFVEYTFGDWRWFVEVDTRWHVGLRAMLGSPRSTFGRRTTDAPPPAAHAITVDRRRADALQIELEARFTRGAWRTPGGPVYNADYDLWFVDDAEPYHVLNNCNHLTARWLRRLGCVVRGAAITNDFRVLPVETAAPAAPPPPAGSGRSLQRAAAPSASPATSSGRPW